VVNARGGINGSPTPGHLYRRPADAAKSLAAAQQLINVEHVIALVADENPSTGLRTNSSCRTRVPVVGSAIRRLRPRILMVPDCTRQLYNHRLLSGAGAKRCWVTKYGIMYCTGCQHASSTIRRRSRGPAIGGIQTLVKTIRPDRVPNFTTPCIQMRAAGVTDSTSRRVSRASRVPQSTAADRGCTVIHVMGESGPQLLQTPQVWLGGAPCRHVPALLGKRAAGAELPQRNEAVLPKDQLTAASAQEWASFEMFQAALEKVPNDPMTPATVKKACISCPTVSTQTCQCRFTTSRGSHLS